MKKKTLILFVTFAIATMAFTACGDAQKPAGKKELVTEKDIEAEEKTEIEEKAETEGLPYLAEIVYPDPSYENIDKSAWDEVIRKNEENKNICMNPYLRITNTSEEAYTIDVMNSGNSIAQDFNFEPEESLILIPKFQVKEDNTCTWESYNILTYDAIKEKDILHRMVTIHHTEENVQTRHAGYEITNLTIPAVINPYINEMPLERIFYYDAAGNLVGMDTCSGSTNKFLSVKQPSIWIPEGLEWDYAEVHYSYQVPDNSPH